MSITEKAMLARLTVSQWTARKHDRKVSAEVAEHHNTTTDAGRYNKVLIAKDALADIQRAANAARDFHYQNSLPWMDEGYRILPAGNFFAYSEAMRGHRAAFDSAVAKFAESYPEFVADARRRLNGLFNEADYPLAAGISRRFGFDVGILPLPDAADFRVTLNTAEQDRIRAEIEARTTAAIQTAVADLWHRVHDTVAHMAERLAAYAVDPATGKVANPFRDSLVGNLRELADLLPRLNMTGDPDLERMRAKLVAELCACDPAALRDSDALRGDVAGKAAAIASEAKAMLDKLSAVYA